MGMSIRNRETERAVRQLAAETGLGLTEAIDMAVRAQLAARDSSPEAVERRRERMDRMAAWLREHVDRDAILTDDDLYDDAGLPR